MIRESHILLVVTFERVHCKKKMLGWLVPS